MAGRREPGGSAATRYVCVRHGHPVRVCQALRHGEARTIMRVFERLSERSRRLRFNGPTPCLRAADLREFASVDVPVWVLAQECVPMKLEPALITTALTVISDP